MQYNLKNEFQIYTNALDIKTDASTMVRLSNLYEKFGLLPSNFQDVHSIKKASVLRPKLTTSDDKWIIRVGVEKFGVVRKLINSTDKEMENTSLFASQVEEVTNLFCDEFQKSGSRIAFYSSIFIDEIKEEEFKKILHNSNKPIEYYQMNEPLIWTNEFISTVPFELSDGKIEELNVVTTYGRAQAEVSEDDVLKELDGIRIELDINSDVDVTELRWKGQNISDFLHFCIGIRQEIINQVKGRI